MPHAKSMKTSQGVDTMSTYVRMITLVALIAASTSLAHAVDGGQNFSGSALPPPEPEKVAAPSLYDAFLVGDISPLGIKADSIRPDDLANHASGYLAGANTNNAEASFWLKQVIAAPAVSPKVRAWALMRLGILTYTLNTTESHVLARQMWELAGAWGQPEALCNLGKLAQEGDDVAAPDHANAIIWYTRAKTAGCSAADTALAGLQKP